MSTEPAWIRVSRACQNACVFCSDGPALDGAVVPLETIQADIDAAVAAGATSVLLSGGEPTQAKHLLGAIRYAKAKGLYVSMTTNARIVQSEKVAQMLVSAGLDEVHVSVHSGRRSTHDALAAKTNAWVEGLAGLRFLTRTPVKAWMYTVLNKANEGEIEHLMHMGTMAGIKGFQLRAVEPLGKLAVDRPLYASLELPLATSLRLASGLWFYAKEEVIAYDLVGFDDTVDMTLEPQRGPSQADTSALRLLRRRVWLEHAQRGFTILDDESMGKDFSALCESAGGLAAAGLELAARGAPLLDAPPCVGGLTRTVDAWAADATWGPDCEACPARAACAGLPKKLSKLGVGVLAPRPGWAPLAGSVAIVAGASSVDAARTLPALAAALGARGVDAAVVTADDARVASAALVIAGDAAAAAQVVARADRAAGQRVIALDLGLGQGLAALDGVEVRAHAPGRVDAYVAAGVALGRVTWKPYPVGPALRDAPYSTQGPVVALGDTADWAQLARELAGREGLPPMHVIVSAGVEVPDSPRWRVHRDLDDATIADAILTSRAVLFPARRVGKDATAAHARDLAWVAFAQSCGRPVVTNRAMGVEDLVRHEVTGLAPARGEAMSSIAETLHRLCGDEPKLRRLAAGALRVHAAGSVDAWADELVKGAGWTGGAATAGRPFPTW